MLFLNCTPKLQIIIKQVNSLVEKFVNLLKKRFENVGERADNTQNGFA